MLGAKFNTTSMIATEMVPIMGSVLFMLEFAFRVI